MRDILPIHGTEHSKREVIINFRTKTRGLYEIIEPVLEASEVFDSSMLKETINSLIASGKRNFAIDMSPLDYIYSDTINMLMALNKRVLDVTGRLSLMAPQPEVMQILKRAGIHNILRVFETETDLIRSSEDMIMQTSSISRADVDAARKQGPPPSEFDQLRSEIGSVFGESDDGQGATPQEGTSGADEFDQMFQQFGNKKPQGANRGGPLKPPSAPPPQPSAPQQPGFQPKQFSPPPSKPMPMHPGAPVQPRQPADAPRFNQEYPTVRSETQRFATAPGAAASQEQHFQPPPSQEKPYSFPEEAESFEASAPVKPPRKKSVPSPSFDDDDFSDSEITKKSSVPILLIVLLIVILGGIGAYVVYMTLGKKKTPPPVASVTAPPPQQQVTPQIPVETPDTVAQDTTATEKAVDAVAPEKEIVKSKPEVRRPPVRKKPVVKKRTPKKRSTPPPAKRRTTPATTNRVIISSLPSGASLSINGKKVGTTPYTWSKPVFGKVSIELSKSGYEESKKSFEYTGGSIKQSVTLTKAVARSTPPPPPPPAPPKKPVVVEKAEPKVAPPPPPPPVDDEEIDDPFADIDLDDDDFDSEPEQKTVSTPPPAVKKAPPPPPAAASSGSGGTALIFIASIPPVADVYLNGKLIGKTNVSELKIPAGMQNLKFVKGGKEITKQLNLQPGKNPSQMVRLP